MIGWAPRAWKSRDQGTSAPQSQNDNHDEHIHFEDTVVTLEGRIMEDKPLEKSCREILLDDTTGTPRRIRLDADNSKQISSWMTIKGARKLICPGVYVSVVARPTTRRRPANHYESQKALTTTTAALQRHDPEEAATTDTTTLFLAHHMVLIGALPATPYLARLLSFPLDILERFFTTTSESSCLDTLGYALRPIQQNHLLELLELCQNEKKEGRWAVLFKHPALAQLCESIRNSQGWTRGARGAKVTSSTTWAALLRMEGQWCQPCQEDTSIVQPNLFPLPVNLHATNNTGAHNHDESDDHSTQPPNSNSTHPRIVYNGIDVDPSLNLPDRTDPRRLKYIDERKRPQVLWMLSLIQNMVEGRLVKRPTFPLSFVDIGGGRGDLANAIAAFFSQSKHAFHITLLDINRSSLDAAKQRAMDANIASHMTFALCDLADKQSVKKTLQNVDFVFGLHCCGGLAEAAVELALMYEASFCISTCCFRSNTHLASLTVAASVTKTKLSNKNTQEEKDNTFQADLDLVSSLSIIKGAEGQHRAIQAINSMRLVAAEEQASRNQDKNGAKTLKTRLLCFPKEYSVQNSVLVGEFIEKE